MSHLPHQVPGNETRIWALHSRARGSASVFCGVVVGFYCLGFSSPSSLFSPLSPFLLLPPFPPLFCFCFSPLFSLPLLSFPPPPFFFYPPFRWSPPDCSLVRRVAHPGRLLNRSMFQRTGMVVWYTTCLVRPGGQLPWSPGIIDHPLKGVSTNKFCRIACSFCG
jgi:hypothetical protein